MWESCVQEWKKILQRAVDRAGVACKEVFSWCCVSLLLTVQKDNCQLLGLQSIIIFWTTKEMKIHCVGRMNFEVSRGS